MSWEEDKIDELNEEVEELKAEVRKWKDEAYMTPLRDAHAKYKAVVEGLVRHGDGIDWDGHTRIAEAVTDRDGNVRLLVEKARKALAKETASPESGEVDGILRLEHLKRVHLEPDDFLVIESPVRMTEEHVTYLNELVKGVFGEGRRVIVLEDGMKLGVVSPREKPGGDYQKDADGRPICPHCEAVTNAAYACVPNLTCWDCGKPMEVTT